MGGTYHYLIAGLKDISFDDEKLQYSFDAYREEVWQSLSASDRKLVGLLYEEYDRRNLVALLKAVQDQDVQLPAEGRGLYTRTQLEELIAAAKADEALEMKMPQYMYDFAAEYAREEWQQYTPFAADRLEQLFCAHAQKAGNEFVRDWFGFNMDLANLQAAYTARKHRLDVSNMIVGEGEVADALRSSGARDWGLASVLDFFDEMARIQDEPDLAMRERRVDMLRWRWLDEHSFTHFFTVEQLFAYLVKMQIVERWSSLDSDEGQKLLRRLISGLKEEVSVPSEFGNN